MQSQMEVITSHHDQSVTQILAQQIKLKSDPDFGGYLDPETGFAQGAAWGSGIACDMAVSAYCAQGSRYYRDEHVLICARDFLAHVLYSQNTDGTMDQKASNFEDATATAFTVIVLGCTFEVLSRYGGTHPVVSEMMGMLLQIMQRSAGAMVHGGFHTPNHRWVLCCAMSICHAIVHEECLNEMIDRYLAEGIDQNADGEFTEKSISVYDPMVDLDLIILSENLMRPELLNYVQKNLEMVLYFLQADGSLFTANSCRQDKDIRAYPDKYFLPYLYMSHHTNNQMFGHMAKVILHDVILTNKGQQEHQNILGFLLLHPDLQTEVSPWDGGLPTQYERWFSASGLIRIRHGDAQLSLIENASEFLHFQFGNVRLRLRVFSSFFARGQFMPEQITAIPKGYRLSQTIQYGYIRPFINHSPTSDWRKMPHGDWAQIENFNRRGLYPKWENINHGLRETCHEISLRYEMDVLFEQDKITLHLRATGRQGVPLKIEFSLDAGGILITKSLFAKGEKGGHLVVRTGECFYRFGADCLRFGPAFGSHYCTDTMRGCEPRNPEAFTICFTEQTPLENTIFMRFGKNIQPVED